MNKLGYIEQELRKISVPYEFGQWTKAVKYPYFVGELGQDNITAEDGVFETAFILNGWNRGKTLDLEVIKEKVIKHFNPIYGLRIPTETGALIITYESANYIPQNDSDLKKIEINLKITEWKGDF
nr:MAG TPA: hypothetical protein [Caudoviricetes sp.]